MKITAESLLAHPEHQLYLHPISFSKASNNTVARDIVKRVVMSTVDYY